MGTTATASTLTCSRTSRWVYVQWYSRSAGGWYCGSERDSNRREDAAIIFAGVSGVGCLPSLHLSIITEVVFDILYGKPNAIAVRCICSSAKRESALMNSTKKRKLWLHLNRSAVI